jgi:uncharacterized protein
MDDSNAQLIKDFYAAFARRDGDTMAASYAPDATFADPVFPGLKGKEPGQMWRMLTSGEGDLKIELADSSATGDTGSAHWIARYTFPQTGRHVVNDIHATFQFKDGKILHHRDKFSFYRWARQAFGPLGVALGWTPILKGIVRRTAGGRLEEFKAADAGA